MSSDLPTDPYQLVRGLRVVRQYQPEPVSIEDQTAILEAGRWTGSAKNRQDWRFIVIDDAQQQSRLATCGNFTQPLQDATFLVVLVRLPDAYEFDTGRVAQNMMLAGAARGVGSCPVTLHDEDCAGQVLGLPAGHRARYALCFGYPDIAAEDADRTARGKRGRVPLDELVHRNRF
ncbi:MAG: nitroreductase family protein [Acidimicrobiia bacterium]